MRLLPASPRRRRRVVRAGIAAAVVAGVVGLALTLPERGRMRETVRSGKPAVYVPPASEPLRGARAAAARATLASFVAKAVLRADPAGAWRLAAPELRAGTTQAEWRGGALPVVPYSGPPRPQVRRRLVYAYADRVSFDLAFLPPSGKERAEYFTAVLRETGPAGHRRWVVASWAPTGTANPPPPGGVAPSEVPKGVLSPLWLLLPAGILVGGLLLLLGTHAGRSWRRRARRRPAATGRS